MRKHEVFPFFVNLNIGRKSIGTGEIIYGIVQYQLCSFESNTESNKEVFYAIRCLICIAYMAFHHEIVVIRKKGFTKV